MGAYEGIGAGLKALRERRNLSLAQVSTQLRIRSQFIEAIETGQFHLLPGTIYAVGFVRAYAEFLGLDVDKAIAGFREEIGETRTTKLSFPVPDPEQRSPRGWIVVAGAIVAIAIYAAWYLRIAPSDDQPRTVQAVPERLAAVAPPPSAEPAKPDEQPKEQQAPVSAPNPVPAPPPAAGPVMASAPTPAPAPVAPPSVNPAPVPSETATNKIILRATADTWVQIRGTNDEQVISRMMKANDTLVVPQRSGLSLSTGNAGGLEVLVDDQPVPPLGAPGAVRRGIELSAAALRSSASQ